MCSIKGCSLENYEDKNKCILHCKKDDWYKKYKNNWIIWDATLVKLFWKIIKEQLYDIWYNEEHGFDSKDSITYRKIVFPKFEDDYLDLNDYGDLEPSGTNFYYSGKVEYREVNREPYGLVTIFNYLNIKFERCEFLDNTNFSRYQFKNEVYFKIVNLIRILICQNKK